MFGRNKHELKDLLQIRRGQDWDFLQSNNATKSIFFFFFDRLFMQSIKALLGTV